MQINNVNVLCRTAGMPGDFQSYSSCPLCMPRHAARWIFVYENHILPGLSREQALGTRACQNTRKHQLIKYPAPQRDCQSTRS